MKLNKQKILRGMGIALIGVTIYSCSKSFLEKPPFESIPGASLASRAGVEGMLISTYGLLDGNMNGVSGDHTSPWNAWAGSVATDDAHKGGAPGNQGERGELESKKYNATNSILRSRWRAYYAGIARANETLRLLAKTPAGEFSDAEMTQIIAEIRFLRGHYHFEAAKMFNNIPYVDETITIENDNYKVPNTQDPNTYPEAWAKIEADLIFAADNLSPTKAQIGRAHKWAAKALLGKVYMQQAKLEEAKPILTDVILNGTNAAGAKLDLLPTYFSNFTGPTQNGVESVFSIQMAIGDGNDGANGNDGDAFNMPNFLNIEGVNGWGHQPSFNLANAFKTVGGLPMFGTFNDDPLKNDFAFVPNTIPTPASSDPFVPATDELDPRLDWTVGRRGIPYLDWGTRARADANGGPYWGKKWVAYRANKSDYEINGSWKMNTSINYPMIRFSDVLLMAAECEVDATGGDPAKALEYVNLVRARAANPDGRVKEYVNEDGTPPLTFTTVDAANYVINLYPGGAFANKDYAREAVRFERRLELATEGHRFFDLQRFDRINKKYGVGNQTYMATLLNKYMAEEIQFYKDYLGSDKTYPVLDGGVFVAGKHEIYAIPQEEIDRTATVNGDTRTEVLKQNPNQ